MTFDDWLNMVLAYEGRVQRLGQHAFNTLVEVNPRLAELVRGSSLDPFHYDDISGEFLEFAREHWKP